MDVVQMIAVLDGLVAALRTVRVLRDCVLSVGLMLVVVIAVQGMPVGAVDVVDVVAVLDGLVTALRAVLVLGEGVLGVGGAGAHDGSFSVRSDAGLSPQDHRRLPAVSPVATNPRHRVKHFYAHIAITA
jgi:hypothetical protein